MRSIRQLFTRSPKASRSPEAQLQEQLTDLAGASQDQLLVTIHSAQPMQLRLQAVAQLPVGEALNQLALEESTLKIQLAAQARIAAFVDAGDHSPEQLQQQFGPSRALLSIAALLASDNAQQQLLAMVDDQSLWVELAQEGGSSTQRQLAAQQLNDAELLKALLKTSKGRDKAVYRIVKAKCDAIKAVQQQHDRQQADICSLCESLERHSQRSFDPQFNSTFQHLMSQWLALEAQAPAAIGQRGQTALAACQLILDREQEQEVLLQAQRDAVNQADNLRQEIIVSLESLLSALFDNEAVTELLLEDSAQQLAEERAAWQKTELYKAAGKEQQQSLEQRWQAVEKLLVALGEYGSLSLCLARTDYAALQALLPMAAPIAGARRPQLVQQALQQCQDWQQQQRQLQAERSTNEQQVSALIRKARATLGRGQSRQAAGVRRTIAEKLTTLASPGGAEPADNYALPADMASALETLDVELDKIQDWRSYAVQPKMEQLIEKIRALEALAINPEALATRVKTLQDEWKSLSRGSHNQYQDLWEQFNQSAQVAYRPCSEFFQQQAEQRSQNLLQRQQIVEQLEAYQAGCDWEKADWKAVEKIIRLGRQQWRDSGPTDRSQTKECQLRFDRVLTVIQQRLDEEYQRNITAKQQLITAAESAAAVEDVRAAVERVKQLQQQWKTVGPVPRREDQRLWKAFRKNCDAVFDMRQQHSDEFKAGLAAEQQRAEALCASVQALLPLTGPALIDSRPQLEAFKAAFKALGQLPRASEKKLRESFAGLLEQYEQQLSAQRLRANEQLWLALLEVAGALQAVALARIEGGDNDAAGEQLGSMLEACRQGEKPWPKGGLEAVESRLQGIESPAGEEDLHVNAETLRRLCIRAEIACDIDSPDEDKERRMAWQVERLQQGMGQGLTSGAGADSQGARAVMQALVFEWLAAPVVVAGDYKMLFKRFQHCLQLIRPW